jgi:hypothetical protein
MPKFRVGVSWDVPKSGYVIVTAADESEAESLVENMIQQRNLPAIVDCAGRAIDEEGPEEDDYFTNCEVEAIPD